ncbi:hypothetical protein ACFLQ6_01560 [Thermoproteota archaeon]
MWKALFFAMIYFFLVSNVRGAAILGAWGQNYWSVIFLFVGFFCALVWALVMGVLYKKA